LVIQNNKWLLKSNLYSIVLSLKIIGRENGFKKKELGMIQMRIYKQNHYVQSKKKLSNNVIYAVDVSSCCAANESTSSSAQ